MILEELGVLCNDLNNLIVEFTEEEPLQIFVCPLHGETLTFPWEPKQTLFELVENIEKKILLPFCDNIFLKCKNTYLVNNGSLDLQIHENSILQLCQRSNLPDIIFIEVSPGCFMTTSVNFNTKIETIKQIILRTTNHFEFDLEYKNQKLNTENTLGSYNITKGSFLQMNIFDVNDEDCDMEIFIRCQTGKTKTLNVCSNDPIFLVKYRIFILEGTPMEYFKLHFAGKVLENLRTLAEYKIQRESTLHIIRKWGRDTLH